MATLIIEINRYVFWHVHSPAVISVWYLLTQPRSTSDGNKHGKQTDTCMSYTAAYTGTVISYDCMLYNKGFIMNKEHARSISHDEGNMQPLIWGLGETSGSNVQRQVSYDMPWLQFPVLCGTYLHECATAGTFNDTDNFLLHFTMFWHRLPVNAAPSFLVNQHTREDTLWWWTCVCHEIVRKC